MNEQLSEQEVALLAEALEDGFRDFIDPRAKLRSIDMGKLFDTNPLNEETLFVSDEIHFDEVEVRSAADGVGRHDDLGIFDEPSESRLTFALNPFGFNFEKIKTFFECKRNEVIDEYRAHYDRYLDKLTWIDDNRWSKDGPPSFGQWREGVQHPYTKRWFESSILYLINQISWETKKLEDDSDDVPFVSPQPDISEAMRDYRREQMFRNALILGRMVEHYRWKFQHEASIVQRKSQFKQAGLGGGRVSKTKKDERLQVFIEEIEKLHDVVEVMSEDRVVEQAYENARKRRPDMPKTPRIVLDYGTCLRSHEPYKSRYFAVFNKTA